MALAQSQPYLSGGGYTSYAPSADWLVRAPVSAKPSVNVRLTPGFSWQQAFSGPNWVFEDIAFADSQTGFAAAELGKVLKTEDGGASWTTVMDLGFPYYWYGVQALDSQTVVVSGFNNQTGDGVLRWTYDGGRTWSDDIILMGNPSPIRWLSRVAFADSQRSIAMTFGPGIYRTNTGGATAGDWSFVPAAPEGWLMGNFTYSPDGNVWASGIDFCHSSDDGMDWDCRSSIDPVFDGGGVSFPDSQHGWVAGGSISPEVRGWVHRTTDGGATWSDRILDGPLPIRAILFLDDNTGFAAGGNIYTGVGGIYSTTDGGDTWNLDLNTGAEMRGLTVVPVSDSMVEIWAAGYTSDYTGKIYMTQWNSSTSAVAKRK